MASLHQHAQAEYVFDTLAAILKAHGGSLADCGAVRRRHLADPPPTATTLEVGALAVPGLLVEVDLVAAIGS